MMSKVRRSSRHRLIVFSEESPCKTCPQAGACSLTSLDEATAEAFQPLARMAPGRILFSSGQRFCNLYAVRRGILARWQVDDETQRNVVGFYLPGDLAGLGGFAYGRYWYTALAVQPAMVCPLDSETLAGTESPAGMQALRNAMAWQSAVDARQHQYLKLADADKMLAGCLDALRQRRDRVILGPGERLRIPVPLIASHLGLETATVRDRVECDAGDQVAL